MLLYDGKGRSLRTEKQFGHFILSVDWKIEKGAASGIYLRGVPQVQIWDRQQGPVLLQHHGHPLWFRNVFLQELSKESGR